MLIYRYFGSFDEMLHQWALQNNYWAAVAERALQGIAEIQQEKMGEEQKRKAAAEYMKKLFREQAEAVRASPLKREILRWMVLEDSRVGELSLMSVESLGAEISRAFRKTIDPRTDVEAGTALLIGGFYYLALIADRTPVFNGVELHSSEGWGRLYRVLDRMIDDLVEGS